MKATSAPEGAAGKRLAAGLVGGILGATMLVHFIALAYTSRTQPELVRADYYEAGEAHEAELEARRRGEGLGMRLQLDVGGGLTGADVLVLRVGQPAAQLDRAQAARVRLYRPGQQALDREVDLAPLEAEASTGGAACWRAEMVPLAPGRWRARASVRGADGAPVATEASFEVE